VPVAVWQKRIKRKTQLRKNGLESIQVYTMLRIVVPLTCYVDSTSPEILVGLAGEVKLR
jgi:hypothetical protein